MSSHAINVHKISKEEAKRKAAEKDVNLHNFFPSAPHLNAAQVEELNVRLTLALCNDGRPLGLFDKRVSRLPEDDRASHDGMKSHYGLHEFMRLLHPGFTVPSRPVIHEIASDQILPRIKADIKSIIARCDVLAFTSDGWKNTSQNVSYRDLSCHGIVTVNGRYKLVSLLLGMQPLVPKDAQSVASWIRDLLDEYEIPLAKRGVMTADGAEKSAAELAGLEYWWCICHWINLAVHDAIKTSEFIGTEIAGAKALVTAVRCSGEYQARLNSLAGARVVLTQDVETRWSSEYRMISSILKPDHLRALRLLFNIEPSLRISDAGISLLTDIQSVLSVPYDLTLHLESQTKVRFGR
jgi:hypothetical protein